MTAELTLAPPSVPTITSDQRTLIKKTIAKDATDAELELFFYDCTRRGVHPLDRLIHFTKRAGKYTPVTSIDFMRSRAAATGDYVGQDDAEFAGTPKTPAFTARVRVYRFVHGEPRAFTATARWAEYKPEGTDFMWQKMPHTMLAKTAEALALRKGFPQELSGLYEAAEFAQAGDVDTETGEVRDALPLRISPAQQKRMHTIATHAGWKRDELKAFLLTTLGVESSKDIPVTRYEEFCQLLEHGTDAREPGEEG